MSADLVTLLLPPGIAAGAASAVTACIPYRARIVSAKLSPSVAAVANATNFAGLALEANDGAVGAFAAIATAQTTATVSHVVGTVIPFVVTNEIIPAGSVVRLSKSFAASGVAVACTVTLELQKVQ